ncbi:MAG TPA: AmmeMemoRadiSam system protein A [Candidatus Aphodovivens avistercoris]|nr:AmmeMemoRadiSam system protein A [Candidatus Aphodovivens avistercoris]
MPIVAAYAVPHPPLIVPAVGRGEERAIQATIDAYEEIARRIAAHAPDVLVVCSPHAPLYRDCFFVSGAQRACGDMSRFGVRDGALSLPYDVELSAEIRRRAGAYGIPVTGPHEPEDQLDHATYVPLHFFLPAAPDARLVRVGLSWLAPADHRALGRCIAGAADALGRRCVFVASGDLSHKLKPDGPHGFAEEGPAFDAQVIACLAAGDFEGLFGFDEAFCAAAAECGLRSFQMMAGALEGVPCDAELLSYEGPFGVGYAVAAFEPAKQQDEEAAAADPVVALARASVEGFVRTGRPIALPERLPDELTRRRAGAFVSLHMRGELRGCIGTIGPTQDSLAAEIVRNGVLAASEDPRFAPVRPDELDALSYSVDVLAPPEPVADASALDPQRFGVIVEKGWRRGLLLPNLEGVDTVEQQLAIAKRKAGISPDDADVSLQRFEVVRHTAGGKAHDARA